MTVSAEQAVTPPRASVRVRPRDAATLVLIRRDGARPQVLMGRRHGGHAFMPNRWVFPGGRLHRADFMVPAHGQLPPQSLAELAEAAPPARCRALALTAIRETFEETGLMLARPSAVCRSKGVWRDFLGAGALPDLSGLQYIARAITPPGRSRRFDTRFFLADAAGLLSLEPSDGCGELQEVAWLDVAEALQMADVPTPTRWILGEVESRLDMSTQRHAFVRYRKIDRHNG